MSSFLVIKLFVLMIIVLKNRFKKNKVHVLLELVFNMIGT